MTGGERISTERALTRSRFRLPPQPNSSEPSEQSLARSQTHPLGMHCSPLLHRNSLLGQNVLFTKAIQLNKINEIKAFVECASKKLIQQKDERKLIQRQTSFNQWDDSTYGSDLYPRPTRRYSPSLDRTAIALVYIVRCYTWIGPGCKRFLCRREEKY